MLSDHLASRALRHRAFQGDGVRLPFAGVSTVGAYTAPIHVASEQPKRWGLILNLRGPPRRQQSHEKSWKELRAGWGTSLRIAIGVLLLLLIPSLLYLAWGAGEGSAFGAVGYFVVIVGALIALGLGAILMFLVFYSRSID